MTMTEQSGMSTARATAEAAREGGKQVAGETAHQATELARDAWSQARGLVDNARGDVRTQIGQQSQRAASGMRTLSEQIRALAEGRVEETGRVGEVARTAGQRIEGWANRLDNEGVDGFLNDVGRFARRRPGAFLAVCAGLGFVAGRVLKATRAQSSSDTVGSYDDAASYGSIGDPNLATTGPAGSFGTATEYGTTGANLPPPIGAAPVSSAATPHGNGPGLAIDPEAGII
jgi:hypothetical protein